ncbi:MAG: DNA mismatch repair endonuclease MutL [Gemmatimonadota bacterium]|nr:DNA mismatch repair endonuclease MutL [Gemmatimonadota bacterium]MDE2866868.1 DNA mismatch repair endonuclease MutL [Gemmatimonadota bacterium]
MVTRSRIRVLPDHVANQIAAGEVVERPASVVKELVENALDAGAGTVRISIERGGKGRIRVSDDGCGMTREDALVCLDRHATSKIRRAEELREIHTLGFRGEALPSIAAVSRLTIETAAEGEEVGTRLRVLAGRMQGVEDVARRRGTTVDVANLFLSTPVRARFLASVPAETRAVSDVIHSLALAHQGTRFVFESGGRTVLDLPADRGLRSRVEAIWKDAEKAGLIDLSTGQGDLRLAGVIQRPDLARPGFRRSHLYVNGRPFRDGRLVAAADRGYRTTVPEGTRPWLFLFLGMPRVEVDVNVHPGKAEVRFRNRRQVEGFVEAAVRETLEGIESAARWDAGPEMVREGTGTRGRGPVPGAGRTDRTDGAAESGDGDRGQMQLFRGAAGGVEGAEDEASAQRAPRPALLQVHNSFILAETRDGVIIVDQHAAHERVLYERIIAGFERRDGEGQRLLFPFTIRLSGPEMDVVESVRAPLTRLGFEFERFGDGALLVQAVPSPHAYFDAERCMREMIDELVHGSELMKGARNQNERVAMSFACKAAIKAGQKLSDEEMQELFDQLFATELPYHDIHGRPTTVNLRLDELRRSFGRT